jgi:hypothetical protein
MDISNQFSLVDFLAYLFPGITGVLGIYLLLLLTPLSTSLMSLPIDLTTGVLLLALSYVLGVVFSGFAEIIVRGRIRRKSFQWVKETIQVPGFEEEIETAFCVTLGSGDEKVEWSASHFYLCRSMVLEFMPGVAPRVRRQISLRQLRMNLLPAVTLWVIAGVAWGIKVIGDNMRAWGYGLIAGSVGFWVLVVWALANRMASNERREVREVLTAFLAGYKKGLFKEKEDSESR